MTRKQRYGEIFGCWYDEGRIYRRSDSQQTWSILATESVARYKELEALTGIKFHLEVGNIRATLDKEEFQALLDSAKQNQLEAEDSTHCWKERFPYLNLLKESLVYFEK
ncbi:hypothetical protein SK128_010734, partial [Halocaridina rubra]